MQNIIICEYLAAREGLNDARAIPHQQLKDNYEFTSGALYVHQSFHYQTANRKILPRKKTYVISYYCNKTHVLNSYKTLQAAIASAEKMAQH